MTEPLLDIRGLKTHFATDDGIVHAVDGVDLAIGRGETVGVVGESGCGKTVTAMSVLKLIADAARPHRRRRRSCGRAATSSRSTPTRCARSARKEIAMIFQEPMTSLNPVYTVGEQIAEAIRLHEGLSRRGALDKTVEMLRARQHPQSRAARATTTRTSSPAACASA